MFERCIIVYCIAMWFMYWGLLRITRRQEKEIHKLKQYIKHNYPVENRCSTCVLANECPAYNTGIIYPCEHYREVESHGEQE